MPAKPEITEWKHGGLLPKDFPLYLPDFEERFTETLTKPPLYGTIFKKGGWAPTFTGIVERADQVSRDRHICSHGMDNHLLQVTQNAFALSEAFGSSTQRENTVLGDADLAFVALTHDLGYADPTLYWNDKKAPEHAKASVSYVGHMRKMLIDIFPSTDEGLHDSRAALDSNFDLYSRVIIGGSKDPLEMVKHARDIEQNPTPEGKLQLVIAFADKIDFFRSGRLQDVPPPQSYERNPYYYLADAVEEYSLGVTDSAVTYSVRLKKDWSLPKWQEELQQQGFGWILELGEHLASVSGRSFEMNEVPMAV